MLTQYSITQMCGAMLSGTVSVRDHMEQDREEKREEFGAAGTEASDNPREDLT